MNQLQIISHPLVQHKLTLLRDENTGGKEFRELLLEITLMMGYEITRNLPAEQVTVQTPLGKCQGLQLSSKLALVPLLRGGLSMEEGMLRLVPTAKVGHVGVYRDPKTFRAVEYYCKLPDDLPERETFVLDPMLGTGGTASAALTILKQRGCAAGKLKMVSLIVSRQSVERLAADHPDVPLYAAALDDELNAQGYAVPGLGDLGVRLFGTK